MVVPRNRMTRSVIGGRMSEWGAGFLVLLFSFGTCTLNGQNPAHDLPGNCESHRFDR
jgi:hypothetical protein